MLRTEAGDFFGRPFKVIELIGGFSKAIASAISDPDVKRIAERGLIGNIDQTDVVSHATWREKVRKLYL